MILRYMTCSDLRGNTDGAVSLPQTGPREPGIRCHDGATSRGMPEREFIFPYNEKIAPFVRKLHNFDVGRAMDYVRTAVACKGAAR
ncbi:MAG: hypothetical protein LBT45_00870 [Rickettsiales bacterium]|nr:hypothetical protein [Rickettsiales bacterium]